MSIRKVSGGFLGILLAVIVIALVSGCGDNGATSVDTTAPAAPAGLRASANYSDIYLRWSANSEADLAGYNVYSSVDGGALELVAVLPPTSTIYQQTCERDHQYGYEITALDQSANESESSERIQIMHDGQPGGGPRLPSQDPGDLSGR